MKDFPTCKNVDYFVQFDIIIKDCMKNYKLLYLFCLVWFDALHPSQQKWSCWDGQFTSPSFFGQALTKQLTSTSCTYF